MVLRLPEQYWLANRLAFATYNVLQSYVVEGEKAHLGFFKVNIRPDHREAMEGLQGEALWDWFNANGYSAVLPEYSYRHLVFALLADLCQFVYEALSCSEKGKLTVAYALLRKPLQDNLFFLEWLLADRKEFLVKFSQGPEYLDLGRAIKEKELKRATRIDIIGRAMDKTVDGQWLDPEYLYDLRYAKEADYGLDRIFNQSLHLVTTFKHYATEPNNINFIFTDDEARDSQWSFFYLHVPSLLRHTLNIVRELFRTLDQGFDLVDRTTALWLTVGYILCAASLAEQNESDEPILQALIDIRDQLNEEPLNCPSCAALIDFNAKNMAAFWRQGLIVCQHCASQFRLLEPNSPIGEADVAGPEEKVT